MAESLTIGDVTLRGRVFIAPMTGVSDLPFRRAASKLGAPYVATEMVACDAFAQARPDVLRRAAVGEGLSPMVMQLVGREPHWISRAAKLSADAGAVTGVLSGSALMRDLDLAERLISAAVEATARPVTLKMRLGWDNDSRNAPELAARAERCGVRAVTVHGRTRAQFYKGEVDWRAVAEVKSAVHIPVIVNGDVVDVQTARTALSQSGADAVMIGRGACGRPWLAATLGRALATGREASEPDPSARLAIVLDHLRDSLNFYGDSQGLRIFRKHLARYVETAPWPPDQTERSAARSALCRMTSASEVEAGLVFLWSGEPLLLAA
jgi:nifR3 family TIM-barrel protein